MVVTRGGFAQFFLKRSLTEVGDTKFGYIDLKEFWRRVESLDK